jgi:hypothetical protein
VTDDFNVQWSVSLPPTAQYAKGDMLNIRGATVDEVEEKFDAILRGEFIDKAIQVGHELRAQQVVVEGLNATVVPQNTGNAPAESAPAQQGSGHFCEHGERKYVTGNGRTGAWAGYFCPLPKGSPGQCKPEFVDSK